MDIPILGQDNKTTRDGEAKVAIRQVFAIICSEHGILAYDASRTPLQESGIVAAHVKMHDEFNKRAEDTLSRIRANSNAREKMQSTSLCQCPCRDHTGCIPEDREHTVKVPEGADGFPFPSMVCCTPCRDYWAWREEEMAKQRAEWARQDEEAGEPLHTAVEWSQMDRLWEISDWEGFRGVPANERMTKDTYEKRKALCVVAPRVQP